MTHCEFLRRDLVYAAVNVQVLRWDFLRKKLLEEMRTMDNNGDLFEEVSEVFGSRPKGRVKNDHTLMGRWKALSWPIE